jgi:potassium efflux system protein
VTGSPRIVGFLLASLAAAAGAQTPIASSSMPAVASPVATTTVATTLAAEESAARFPAVRRLLDENAAIVVERRQVAGRIAETADKAKAVQTLIGKIEAALDTLRETLARPGMESYVWPIVSERRRQLPDRVSVQHTIRTISDDANVVHVRYLMIQDQLDDLENRDACVRDFLRSAELSPGAPGSDMLVLAVRQAFDARVVLLQSLAQDCRTLWTALVELSTQQEKLLKAIDAVLEVINEHALWLPSAQPLYNAKFPARLTPSPETWAILDDAIRRDARLHPTWYAAMGLVFIAWLAGYRGSRLREAEIRQLVAHPYTDTFRLTADAIGTAVYRAGGVPVVLWFLGTRLAACVPVADSGVYAFGMATSYSLIRTAWFIFLTSFFRKLCRKGGVAETHFRWDAALVRRLRHNLIWVMAIGIPAVIVTNLAEFHPDPLWRDSIGRIVGSVALAAIGVFLWRMLKPRTGSSGTDGRGKRLGTLPSMRRLGYFTALAIPFALAVGLCTPYAHTAGELARHLYRTMTLIVILLVARAIVLRFVLVSRQVLAIGLAKSGRTRESTSANVTSDGMELQESAESLPSFETIDRRTRSMVRWLVVLGTIIGAWFIWRDIIPAFSFLTRHEVWTYTSEGQAPAVVSLADLMVGLIALIFTLVMTKNAPDVVDTALLARLPIDAAARFAIITVVRYVILIVGLVIALGAIGLGWSRIHWLAAAVTVGLGFGLQEIFANFISGLIILFERPIRIGDTVTVGDISGTVARIQIRATTIMGWDRKELIIPNKEFVTGKVINWTLSDSMLRLVIPVGIAYDANPHEAEALLRKVAHEHPLVLDHPEPVVLFGEFGASSLNFELRVFVSGIDHLVRVRHELHLAIEREFREAGIEIPFPQTDIRVRSFPQGTGNGGPRTVVPTPPGQDASAANASESVS